MVPETRTETPAEATPFPGHVPTTLERAAAPVGGFLATAADTVVAMFRPPFQWREYIQQCWFVASVAIGPTILLGIPFVALVTFQFNQVLTELGAIDLAGAGSAFATVSQIGPVATTFIIAGAVATSICADLGARRIREELDAMEVLGIDPVQRLVVPRVLAAATMAIFLNALLILIGIGGGFFYSVFLQGASPGVFIDTMNTLTGNDNIVSATVRAAIYGALGAMIGAYRGLRASGGAKGVGQAVNETVVYVFIALFPVNTLFTQLQYSLGLVSH
ncbi:MlaE family ABC transporter permease [Pseudonocardia spinosispora]|uniref:MlaE family ABC transporter permease n=1 Tax=Pseudonocardia spinosispora TaxID=103441 RepID=UPI0003FB09A8|nr:ABC transporter permease [Pseudonocardia spinosispora]